MQKGTRRTKAERTKALAAVFKRAGFTRKGAEWYLEQGDLLWNTSLDSYRRQWEDATPFDVHVNARYVPAQTADNPYVYVINGNMGSLPGTRSDPAFNDSYHEYDTEEFDPLIQDAAEVLVSLIKRTQTLSDVFDARLSGEFEDRDLDLSTRISWVHRAAQRIGVPAYMERTQQMVNAGRWTYEDRVELEKVGMTVPPETRIPEGFFERIRRWIEEIRDRGWRS